MYAIKNVSLPGKPGTVNILVENGRIQAIGPEVSCAEAVSVMDATGLYAIPGLIEAHTRMGGSSSFDYPSCGSIHETYDYVEAREGFLRWGITAARTCGDRTNDVLAFREKANSGKIRSPRIVCCGPFIQAVEGHPWATVYMRQPEIAKEAVIFADESIIPAERQVANIAQLGVDYIKVFYAHLNKVEPQHPVPRLTREQLHRIVDSAHRNKLRCAVHVDGPEEMSDAVDAGADSIEHMIGANGESTYFSPELIDKLKQSGAIVVPTMISILRFDDTPGYTPVYEQLKVAVKQFYDAGIPLAVGCDSGIPFVPQGESLHDEMVCLAETGIPNLEILRMVSETNAKLLGLETEIGSLEAGKRADIVLLGADPAEDIRNTRNIRMVFLDGHVVVDKR